MKKKIVFFTIVIVIAMSVGVYVFIINNNKLSMMANEQKTISDDMLYDTVNMQLINDYDTFYTLEKISKKIIMELKSEEYKAVMGNISQSYFERESEAVILEKLQEISKVLNDSEYEINDYSKLLYRVYEKDTNLYNCLLDIDGNIYYVLILLNEQDGIFEIYNIILAEE